MSKGSYAPSAAGKTQQGLEQQLRNQSLGTIELDPASCDARMRLQYLAVLRAASASAISGTAIHISTGTNPISPTTGIFSE